MEIVKIRNLSFTFEGSENAVLDNIDFNIKKVNLLFFMVHPDAEKPRFCGLLKRK